MVHTQKILKWTFKSLGPEIAAVAARERPCLIGCKATTEATEGKGGSHQDLAGAIISILPCVYIHIYIYIYIYTYIYIRYMICVYT
jgi:hypothetical protein